MRSHTSINLEKELVFSRLLHIKLDIPKEIDIKILAIKVFPKTISAMIELF